MTLASHRAVQCSAVQCSALWYGVLWYGELGRTRRLWPGRANPSNSATPTHPRTQRPDIRCGDASACVSVRLQPCPLPRLPHSHTHARPSPSPAPGARKPVPLAPMSAPLPHATIPRRRRGPTPARPQLTEQRLHHDVVPVGVQQLRQRVGLPFAGGGLRRPATAMRGRRQRHSRSSGECRRPPSSGPCAPGAPKHCRTGCGACVTRDLRSLAAVPLGPLPTAKSTSAPCGLPSPASRGCGVIGGQGMLNDGHPSGLPPRPAPQLAGPPLPPPQPLPSVGHQRHAPRAAFMGATIPRDALEGEEPHRRPQPLSAVAPTPPPRS